MPSNKTTGSFLCGYLLVVEASGPDVDQATACLQLHRLSKVQQSPPPPRSDSSETVPGSSLQASVRVFTTDPQRLWDFLKRIGVGQIGAVTRSLDREWGVERDSVIKPTKPEFTSPFSIHKKLADFFYTHLPYLDHWACQHQNCSVLDQSGNKLLCRKIVISPNQQSYILVNCYYQQTDKSKSHGPWNYDHCIMLTMQLQWLKN